jgi:hypothetical protein
MLIILSIKGWNKFTDNLNPMLIINHKKAYKLYKTSIQQVPKIIVILCKKRLRTVTYYYIHYYFHHILFIIII